MGDVLIALNRNNSILIKMNQRLIWFLQEASTFSQHTFCVFLKFEIPLRTYKLTFISNFHFFSKYSSCACDETALVKV